MVRRVAAGLIVGGAMWGGLSGVAGATLGPDAKQAFPVVCQVGSLVGQTVTVLPGKTAYLGTQELRLTALSLEFDGKSKDNQYGKIEGNITCGGTEVNEFGTFTFFATLRAV